MAIHHIDGDPSNNNPSNVAKIEPSQLDWTTPPSAAKTSDKLMEAIFGDKRAFLSAKADHKNYREPIIWEWASAAVVGGAKELLPMYDYFTERQQLCPFELAKLAALIKQLRKVRRWALVIMAPVRGHGASESVTILNRAKIVFKILNDAHR